MPKRSVFCISASRGRADRIVHDLKEAGFAGSDLSILFLNQSATERHPGNKATPAAAVSAAVPPAAEIRGVLAWIPGIRPLVIPGVSPLIAAGPIAAALSSATVGGIAGGLTDFNVPQTEAARYEGRINGGDMLIAVHSENPERSNQAREIFTANEAENICTMIEVLAPRISLQSAYGPPR
jgi:hypothetical protein